MLIKFIKLLLVICIYFIFNTEQVSSQTVRVSDFGFNSDDSTKAIIDALNSISDTIIFDKQKSDWITLPISIKNIHKKTLIFEKGVSLRAKSGEFKNPNDRLFEIINGRDINIIGYGATFIMEKKEYNGGEWRHAISLRNCKNIIIKGLTIKDSGGDGIYIAGLKKGTYSENILIEDIKSINNRRQGMSIISVQNLLVKNSSFNLTNGTLPGAGVDIEPNNSDDRAVNIRFEKCSFVQNNHAGIVLALNKLDTTSIDVSIEFYDCYLSMNHHPDNKYPASEIIFSANNTNPVKGKVLFEECFIDRSNWGLFYSRKQSNAYHVTFKNCAAKNICQNNSMAPIYLEVPDYYKTYGSLGGYTFDNLLLEYKVDLPLLVVRGSKLNTLKNLEDINGSITAIGNITESFLYKNYNPENNINVNITNTVLRE